jgi:hypothetical protein
VKRSGTPNQFLGVLLHTTAISGLSPVRTEFAPLLMVPSLAHHPVQTNRQSPRHGDLGGFPSSSHHQVEILELCLGGDWFWGEKEAQENSDHACDDEVAVSYHLTGEPFTCCFGCPCNLLSVRGLDGESAGNRTEDQRLKRAFTGVPGPARYCSAMPSKPASLLMIVMFT